MAVFTGTVDSSIKRIWNRINLALIFHCLPSAIPEEANKDIEAAKVILAAREEMKTKATEGDQNDRMG